MKSIARQAHVVSRCLLRNISGSIPQSSLVFHPCALCSVWYVSLLFFMQKSPMLLGDSLPNCSRRRCYYFVLNEAGSVKLEFFEASNTTTR